MDGSRALISHNAALFEKTTEDLTAYQMAYLQAMMDGVSAGFTKTEILKKYHLGTSANIKVIQKALVEKEIIEATRVKSSFLDPTSPFGSKTNLQSSNCQPLILRIKKFFVFSINIILKLLLMYQAMLASNGAGLEGGANSEFSHKILSVAAHCITADG